MICNDKLMTRGKYIFVCFGQLKSRVASQPRTYKLINDDKTEFLVIGSGQQLLKIHPVLSVLALLILSLLKERVTSALGSTRTFLCRPIFLCLVVGHFSGYIISRE